jgi:hypothetical protein
MSRTKDHSIDMQNRPVVAEQILVEAGCLERCEFCEGVKDPHLIGCDLQRAYKLANKKITEDDPFVECFHGDRQALTDLIKERYESCPKECECKRRRNDEE